MEHITYKELKSRDINLALFNGFNRYQEITHCWRKENNLWVLKEIAYIEQWEEKGFISGIRDLQYAIDTGGSVFAAYSSNKMIGFGSIRNEPLGSINQYLQLEGLHVSYESRGNGIGKALFYMICDKARQLGATKLYISSHSSKETQAFYKAVGCVEAIEYNKILVEKEPYDCQLEFVL